MPCESPPRREVLGRALAFLRPGGIRLRHLPTLARLARLQGFLDPQVGEPVRVDNRALDGFLDGWPRRGCRERSCQDCGYCERWSERAVQVDPEFQAEALALHEEILELAEAGALW